MRIFWEKSDFDDTDPNSAFRKRQKEKMKLRKKPKYEIESYKKMFDLRNESIEVLKVLKCLWTREDYNKKIGEVKSAVIDTEFD
jgi:hypothetical protein